MLIANQQNVYIAFCILLFDKKVITMEFVAKVIKFGRVTIPQEIRELLGIREGDMVTMEVKKIHRKEVIEK